MNKIYDTIIIGAGPAGASAAIYASRARLSALWLDNRLIPGGQIADSGQVDNYPGLPGISGADMGEAFAAHAKKLGMEPVREEVIKISCPEQPGAGAEDNAGRPVFHITTDKEQYRAYTVIYAAGAAHRHLGIPGEEELSGAGVSYCATCDGAFYRDDETAVIGGGNTACEDALFLSRICSKVYLIHRRDQLRADAVLQELVRNCGNIEILWNTVPETVEGEEEGEVTGLRVRNVADETTQTLPVPGVFIAAGMIPNTDLVKDLVRTDDAGYIIADETGRTSCPGLFAAGDIRTKNLRQVVTAVSDGANAVNSVQHYLL